MLRRHAPDVVSLVFGILFAGFTAIWALSASHVIEYKDAWIGGPAILIVAGITGLLLALRRDDVAPEPVPWATGPEPTVERPGSDRETVDDADDADDADAISTEPQPPN